MTMNKKSIFIIVGLLVVILLPLIIIIYLSQTSVSSYSNKIQKITIDNSWAKSNDFTDCRKDQKNCIILASSFIEDGTYIKAYYTNYDLVSLQNDIKKMNDLINNKKYRQVYKQAETTIKNINKNYEAYIKANQENFDQIDKLVYEKFSKDTPFALVNYQIVGDWAKVGMILQNKKGMPAWVILKKTNNNWAIVAGPTTSFDSNLAVKYPNMPDIFMEYPKKNGAAIVVVNKNGKKPSTSSLGGESIKSNIDPLSGLLPYYADAYVVESELVNGLPVYTVSYFNTNGNSLEKTKLDFKSWLKEVGVEVKDSSIKYKDIDEPDNSSNSINVID